MQHAGALCCRRRATQRCWLKRWTSVQPAPLSSRPARSLGRRAGGVVRRRGWRRSRSMAQDSGALAIAVVCGAVNDWREIPRRSARAERCERDGRRRKALQERPSRAGAPGAPRCCAQPPKPSPRCRIAVSGSFAMRPAGSPRFEQETRRRADDGLQRPAHAARCGACRAERRARLRNASGTSSGGADRRVPDTDPVQYRSSRRSTGCARTVPIPRWR